jgi:hypothetical protein
MTNHRRPQSARLAPASEPALPALAEELARLLDVADPRNLKPGELIRSLNSTPLGQVLSEKLLRKHRERAGLAISDESGKRLDLLRYAAWLAHQRHKAPASVPQGTTSAEASAYALKKERERQRNADISITGRDIGELPPVADPERRARGLADPIFFCETYFPKRFKRAMSQDQKASIRALAKIVEHGGTKAYAAPRGDGKTTRAEVLAIWAILKGLRRFVAFIAATRQAAAEESLPSIKGEFETNELLLADFPEVCYPVHCLEGIHNKCKGQLYRGKPTRMKWSGDLIVLPTIEGSPASGAVICVRSITGRIRGMKYRLASGETIRPDLAIVDDPQTERSAASALQCTKRLNTITGAILGLAGPGEAIACFVPCTVIFKGDLADQILDASNDQFAAFQGVRTKLVYQWPTNTALWEEYAEIRRAGLRRGDRQAANAFYQKHRKEMDAGAVVAWEARREAGEISAIQNAMNLRIDRAATFDAEYQNEPRDPASDDEKILTPAEIAAKTSGLARGVVPLAATQLTAFIDVQQRALYWAACGWSPEFTGSCIDYGTWPDQGRSFFVYREIARTIQKQFPAAGVPGGIRGALDRLIAYLATREFTREDGATMRVSKIAIDSGNWTDVIYQCVRESPHAALLVASKGKGVTSDRAPISEWKRHEGQVIGEEWMLGRVENKRATRLLTYDTHYWKTRLHSGLATAVGDRGCFTLFGSRRQSEAPDHSMIAAHLTAETRKKTEGGGRVVFVYALRPEKPDNHLLDCLVGNHVLASLLGCRLIGQPVIATPPKPARKRSRVSPLQC